LRLPTSDHESIVIGAVPFIRSANFLRKYLSEGLDTATLTYGDSVGTIQEQVGRWMSDGYDPSRDIRIFAAHLLLDNAQPSGSEYHFHVDSDFAVRPQRIPTAEYVAFGHIHKPQAIGGLPNGRYAGSPIPIDFGERADEKSVVVVTGRPGYSLETKVIPLAIQRRMIDITETLDTISANRKSYTGKIARVTVLLDTPVDDLERRVRDMLEGASVCSVRPRYPAPIDAVPPVGGGTSEASLTEMLSAYMAGRDDVGDQPRVSRYFAEFLDQLRQGQDLEAGVLADLGAILP
jgi:exonuclease SbcD